MEFSCGFVGRKDSNGKENKIIRNKHKTELFFSIYKFPFKKEDRENISWFYWLQGKGKKRKRKNLHRKTLRVGGNIPPSRQIILPPLSKTTYPNGRKYPLVGFSTGPKTIFGHEVNGQGLLQNFPQFGTKPFFRKGGKKLEKVIGDDGKIRKESLSGFARGRKVGNHPHQ